MAGAAAELRRIAEAAQALPRDFATDAAKTIRAAADRRLVADTGGDRELSNAPGKLSVTSKVTGDRVVHATVTPGRRGANRWVWLEVGTRPHRIGRFRHPGTAGKQTWSQPTTKAVGSLSRDVHRRFDRIWRGG